MPKLKRCTESKKNHTSSKKVDTITKKQMEQNSLKQNIIISS